MIELDRGTARRYLLAWQGLAALPGTAAEALPRGKAGVLEFVRRVGCIQFDPLDICGHNHDLVLQARVKGYRKRHLRDLLYQDRVLVDGMDKVMSIYPAADWPCLARRRRLDGEWAARRSAKAAELAPHILEEMARRGPLSSLELDFHEEVDWAWAPTRLARAALDLLYYRGDLAVHHKVHTRKYYDLASRLLPPGVAAAPEPFASEEEYLDWHALRRIGGVGLLWNRGGDAWVGIPGWNAASRSAAIGRQVAAGRLLECRVEGIGHPFHLPERSLPWLEAARAASKLRPAMRLLAPLDNLLWDRQLLEELFDFDYRWEVYTPAVVRKYGYYILPVLYRDRLVARCEPVRLKKEKTLLIKNWWWEPGCAPEELRKAERESLLRARELCLGEFAAFLGLERVQVGGAAALGGGAEMGAGFTGEPEEAEA
jgi:uncharacterized protein YcaQ